MFDVQLHSFQLKKVETEEEYDQMQIFMEHILDLDDEEENNEYVSIFWGLCQDLVSEYEEKMEALAEEEGEKELAQAEPKNVSVETSFPRFKNGEGDEEVARVAEIVDPNKIAFRGKKKTVLSVELKENKNDLQK